VEGKTRDSGEPDPRPHPLGDSVRLRAAVPEDVPFLYRLSRAAFQAYGDYAEVLKEALNERKVLTLVAVEGVQPVGFGMLGFLAGAGREAAAMEVVALAVEVRHQGQGVGRRLMEALEERAAGMGCRLLRIHTAVENRPARRLFEGRGFYTRGYLAEFYPEGQDALRMEKVLWPLKSHRAEGGKAP